MKLWLWRAAVLLATAALFAVALVLGGCNPTSERYQILYGDCIAWCESRHETNRDFAYNPFMRDYVCTCESFWKRSEFEVAR